MHKNKEIEVKLILEPQQFDALRIWTQCNAVSIGVQEQTDYYFDLPAASFMYTNLAGLIDVDSFLRLRKIIEGQSVLTSKVKTFDPLTDRICDIDEYETSVADGAVTRMILESIGYNVIATIQKKRTIYQSFPFEISFDEVEGLGLFVEIELKEQTLSNQAGINKIHDFMRSIGLTTCRSSTRGYLNMILNPGYDFSIKLQL
jgi:predicted adenylyl cyclase CyaB